MKAEHQAEQLWEAETELHSHHMAYAERQAKRKRLNASGPSSGAARGGPPLVVDLLDSEDEAPARTRTVRFAKEPVVAVRGPSTTDNAPGDPPLPSLPSRKRLWNSSPTEDCPPGAAVGSHSVSSLRTALRSSAAASNGRALLHSAMRHQAPPGATATSSHKQGHAADVVFPLPTHPPAAVHPHPQAQVHPAPPGWSYAPWPTQPSQAHPQQVPQHAPQHAQHAASAAHASSGHASMATASCSQQQPGQEARPSLAGPAMARRVALADEEFRSQRRALQARLRQVLRTEQEGARSSYPAAAPPPPQAGAAVETMPPPVALAAPAAAATAAAAAHDMPRVRRRSATGPAPPAAPEWGAASIWGPASAEHQLQQLPQPSMHAAAIAAPPQPYMPPQEQPPGRETDEQLAARLQRQERRRLARHGFMLPRDDAFEAHLSSSYEALEAATAAMAAAGMHRPDSPVPFSIPRAAAPAAAAPAGASGSTSGAGGPSSAAPRVPDAWRRARSSRAQPPSGRQGWAGSTAAIALDAMPPFSLFMEEFGFPEDLPSMPVPPPPPPGVDMDSDDDVLAGLPSYRAMRSGRAAAGADEPPSRAVRFAAFRESGWMGRSGGPPGPSERHSSGWGRYGGWSQMLPFGSVGGGSMHEMIAGAMRSGLPPHLLFSDRDFTADDYEMLCRLDDTVENRKGASQQEIDGLPTQVVVVPGAEPPQAAASTPAAAAAAASSAAAPAGAAPAAAGPAAGVMLASAAGHAPLAPGAGRCTICLEDWAAGDVLRHLPCSHHFHKDCVDTWLRQKAACPICQRCCKGSGAGH